MSFLGVAHFYDELKSFLRIGADYAAEMLLAEPAIPGDVINIADGDTLTVMNEMGEEMKVRLYGIDAPESSQKYGAKAKQALQHLLDGHKVTVEVIDIDQYGRQVGVLEVDGININELMLEGGHAWFYGNYCRKSFCDRWELISAQARTEKKGLWEESGAEPPWEYRR
ncbi:MAG: thermonuclease family protein [Deferribacteraceae bacterium]|nr:thermonuclease family protein [Deferribacteraceae bacterium]